METRGPAKFELAGYRIEALLGRGGMGEVYRATDLRLDRPVAIKLLAEQLAAREEFGQRLLRESRLAASLDHPNVVPIYEVGEGDGRLFIVMRYVPGGDLRRLVRREGVLEPARALPLFIQVADALDAAHRRGLVHRDVKPSNVLLDRPEGRTEHCYLADFGLTQSVAGEGAMDGQLQGTVDYISPEQIRGDSLDGRADQYGLACLMYECLTGALPFQSHSDVAALYAHLESEVPRASEHAPGLPEEIDAVLARGMAKQPEERFETCEELVGAAAGALGLSADRERRPPRRWPLALAALSAALVVAVLVLVLSGGEGAGATPPSGALVRVDPKAGTVLGSVPIRGYPGQLVATPGGIWMADFRGGVLWRYQPGSAPERITSNGEPRDLAALGRKVYVAADGPFLSGTVSEYDALTAVRGDSIDLLACAIASGEGVVWAAGCPFVQRLSTDDGPLRELAQRFLPFKTPATVENSRVQFRELAVGAGSVWALGDALDQRLWRLDSRTGRVEATINLGFPPTSIAVAGGFAWVTDGLHDRVVPIDARTNRAMAPLKVGAGASGIAAGDGRVWVVSTLAASVSEIDPRKRTVVARVPVGGLPRAVAVGDGAVWVSEYGP